MTSDTQHTESGSSIGRRTFIKGVGAAGAAGVGLSGRAPGSPVGSAEAIPPLVVGGAVAGSVAVGWALRETEVLGSNPPPEGTTEDVLRLNAYETAKSRYSNDRSTFTDNRNILDGIEHTAYTDAKIDAIEALNQEVSQGEVEDAAVSTAREYVAQVQTNLMRSYNETMRELYAIWERGQSHPDIDGKDSLVNYNYSGSNDPRGLDTSEGTTDIELADGTMFAAEQLTYRYHRSSGDIGTYDTTSSPVSQPNNVDMMQIYIKGVDGDQQVMMDWYEFIDLYNEFNSLADNLEEGLGLWVNSVYSEVQSGEIDIAELLTPREQAALLSDDEEYPQAVADLIALNIPVDPDREATISFVEREITISGLMAPTTPPEGGFNVGETYDPSAEPWDLYFTYDPSRGSGGWSEYGELIAEGELRFTEEPYDGVLYRVPTNLGTVEVVSDDFEEIDGGLWAADVSEQIGRTTEEWTDYQTGIDGGTVTFGSLPDEAAEFDITTNQGDTETVAASDFEGDGDDWTVDTSLGIAEVESVTAHIDRATIEDAISIYSEDGSANYETVQIREEFTLDRLEDSDGNDVESAEFSQTEPQNDENYITQDEWDDLEQQNQELIDKYEEAAGSDDGFFGGGGFDFGEIGEIPGGATAAAAGVAIVVVIVGVLRQVASFYLPGR